MKLRTLLTILFGINVVVGAGYFLFILPMQQEARTVLNTVRGEVSGLQGKIASIKQDKEALEKSMPAYDELKDKGFFMDQDRFMIKRWLDDMQKKSDIASFSFSIADINDIQNPTATGINSRLINSRIKVEKIVSALDTNIYSFLQDIENSFPEHTRIQSFNIRRSAPVTEDALKKIASGEVVSFVNASIVFDWLTLVPKVVTQAPGTSPGSTVPAGIAPTGFRGR